MARGNGGKTSSNRGAAAGGVGGTRATGSAVPLRSTYDVVGPADAPAIVCLHGTRVTRTMWDPQVAGLADRYRVIALDLPGHGMLADVRFTVERATDHVAAVIDEAAGGRAVLVGQSLGGYVAMDVAATRPERVAGLVLCNSTAEPRTLAGRAPRVIGSYLAGEAGKHWRRRRSEAARRAAQGPASSAAPATDDPAGTAGDADRALDEEAAIIAAELAATNGWLFKGGLRAAVAALRTSFLARLRTWDGQTLIVNGGDDPLFRRWEDRFLDAARHGRLVVLEGAGHLANEDRPDEFNAALGAFVDEVWPAPAAAPA